MPFRTRKASHTGRIRNPHRVHLTSSPSHPSTSPTSPTFSRRCNTPCHPYSRRQRKPPDKSGSQASKSRLRFRWHTSHHDSHRAKQSTFTVLEIARGLPRVITGTRRIVRRDAGAHRPVAQKRRKEVRNRNLKNITSFRKFRLPTERTEKAIAEVLSVEPRAGGARFAASGGGRREQAAERNRRDKFCSFHYCTRQNTKSRRQKQTKARTPVF